MAIHAFINTLAMLILTILWAAKARDIQASEVSGKPIIVFKFLMIALLLFGAYIGRTSARKHF